MRGALENVREAPVDINPKGQLQEILQSIAMRGPTYEVLSATGPEHSKTFVVEARWEGVVLGRGIGLSKQAAEIEAANNALENKAWEKN
jgi:ribonuclease III